MSKRQRMEQFLAGEAYTDGVPAAFFQHFGPSQQHGEAAVDAQLRFFQETDMDFLKIMFDDHYPLFSVEKPEDWRSIPDFSLNDPVFTQELEVVRRLVDRVGKEAPVFQTIFSPFVSAGCSVSPVPVWDSVVTPHLRENPVAVTEGLKKIAATLLMFASQVAQAGVDGFYVSLQGGEHNRYSKEFFETWLKPLDLLLINGLKATGKKVLLHICGVNLRLESYFDYPGDIVNMACVDNQIPLSTAKACFGRPIMGGIPNHGAIVEGTRQEVESQVQDVLSMDTRGIMLGADCTIPQNVPTQRLRWAVDAAHAKR